MIRMLMAAGRFLLLLMIAHVVVVALAVAGFQVARFAIDAAPAPFPPPSARFDAAHRVEFPSLAPPVFRFEDMGPAVAGYLFRPAGDGPFPAVVLLHGCSGFFGLAGYRRWVDRLVSWGYVVLAVDGLSWRGASVCVEIHRIIPKTYAGDAYGGLRYLAALPFVDPRRIGAMGWSFGGGTLLAAVQNAGGVHEDAWLAQSFTDLGPPRFKAAVAFYPPLFAPTMRFSVPLLVLVGERDGLDNAARLRLLAEHARTVGDPTALHVYPGAYHGFDAETPLEMGVIPFTYDPAATADAAERVRAFFAEHLRRR